MFHHFLRQWRSIPRRMLTIALLSLSLSSPSPAHEPAASAPRSTQLAANNHQHEQEHNHNGHAHDQNEGHGNHTDISDAFALESGVRTELAGPRNIRAVERLYGSIQTDQERIALVTVPYSGEIIELHASIGDQVERGQVVARIKSRESLATYAVKAPLAGVVTDRHFNVGELAGDEPLLTLVDLSTVWLDLIAYPNQREKLQEGQPLEVQDLDGRYSASATIDYIAPQHFRHSQGTLVRADLHNPERTWSPEQMVSAEVVVVERNVPLAIRGSALQTLEDSTVVFVKSGETYKAHKLELGVRDSEYVEVLSGLDPGTEYVTENSYLIKADLLKAGASHAH